MDPSIANGMMPPHDDRSPNELRIAELEAALRTVRQAIVEKADDTFWLSPIETVVDHIDAALGGYADDQSELELSNR